MAYQPLYVIQCQILFIHIYRMFMICKHFVDNILNEPWHIFFWHTVTWLQVFLIQIILLIINQLFADKWSQLSLSNTNNSIQYLFADGEVVTSIAI